MIPIFMVHFEESQFELLRQDGRRKLKSNAIPTQFPSTPRAKPARKSVQIPKPALQAVDDGKQAVSADVGSSNDLPDALVDSPSTEDAAAREQQQLQRVAQAAVAAVKFMESSKNRSEGSTRDTAALTLLAKNTSLLHSSGDGNNTTTAITVWPTKFGNIVIPSLGISTATAVSVLSSNLPVGKEASLLENKANKRQRPLPDNKETSTSKKNKAMKSNSKMKKIGTNSKKSQIDSSAKLRPLGVDNSGPISESEIVGSSKRVMSSSHSAGATKDSSLNLLNTFQDSTTVASDGDSVSRVDQNIGTVFKRNVDISLENNSELFSYMNGKSVSPPGARLASITTSKSVVPANKEFVSSRHDNLLFSTNDNVASSVKCKSVCSKLEKPLLTSNNLIISPPDANHRLISDTNNRLEADNNNRVAFGGNHVPLSDTIESVYSDVTNLDVKNEVVIGMVNNSASDTNKLPPTQRNVENNFGKISRSLENTASVSVRHSRSAATRRHLSSSGSERLVSLSEWRDPAAATALAVLRRKVESLSTTNASLVKSNRHLTRQNLKLRKEMQHKEKYFRTVFNPDQMRALGKDSTRGWNWSDQTIKNALLLKFSCGTAGYEELLKQHYPLPSLRTLQRRVTNAVQSDIEYEAQTNAMQEKASKPVQHSPIIFESSLNENSTDALSIHSSPADPTKDHSHDFNNEDRLLAIELPPSIVGSLDVLPTQTIDDMSSAELASDDLPALELPVETSRYIPSVPSTPRDDSRCDEIAVQDTQRETPDLVRSPIVHINDTPDMHCDKEYLSDSFSGLPHLKEPDAIPKDDQDKVESRMDESNDSDLCFTIGDHIEDSSRYNLDVSLSQDGYNEHTSNSVISPMEALRTNADRSVSSERCLFFEQPFQVQQQRPSSCPNLLHELETDEKTSDPLLSSSFQPRQTFKTAQENCSINSYSAKHVSGSYGDKNSHFHQHLQEYVPHVQASDQLAHRNHDGKNIFCSFPFAVKPVSRAISPLDKLSSPLSRTPSSKPLFASESCQFTSPKSDFDSELSISVALNSKIPPPPRGKCVGGIDLQYTDTGTMPHQEDSRDKMDALCLPFPSDSSFTLDNSVDIGDIQQSSMEICDDMGHDSIDICDAIAQLDQSGGSDLLLQPSSMSPLTPFTTAAVVVSVSPAASSPSSALGIISSRSQPRHQFGPFVHSPLLSSPRNHQFNLSSTIRFPNILRSPGQQPPLPSVCLSSRVATTSSLAVQEQSSLPGSSVASQVRQPVPNTGAQVVSQSLPVSQATVSLASLLASRGSRLSLQSPYRHQPSAMTPTPPPSVSLIQSSVSQPLGHSQSFVKGPQLLSTSPLQFSNSSSLLQSSSILTSLSINSQSRTQPLITQAKSWEQPQLVGEQRGLHSFIPASSICELPLLSSNEFTQASRYQVTPQSITSCHGAPVSCNTVPASGMPPAVTSPCNPNLAPLIGNSSLELPAAFEDTPQCFSAPLSLPTVFTPVTSQSEL